MRNSDYISVQVKDMMPGSTVGDEPDGEGFDSVLSLNIRLKAMGSQLGFSLRGAT